MSEAIITMVLGRRGSGKSVKVRNLTKQLDRVVYYDTLGKDYTDGVIIYNLDDLKAFWRRHYKGKFRIIYRPENPEEEFPAVCNLVYTCTSMHFVVEELDTYFRQGQTCREFNRLVYRGRHANIDMIGVSQRPFGYGRSLTSQAKEWYVFSTREPDDLTWMKKYFGQEFTAQLEQLNPQDYQYLHWVDTGEMEISKDVF